MKPAKDLQGSLAGKHDTLSHSLLKTSVPSQKYNFKVVTFVVKIIHIITFFWNKLYTTDQSGYLVVDGPVPRFWVHLIVFGFQATVTLNSL